MPIKKILTAFDDINTEQIIRIFAKSHKITIAKCNPDTVDVIALPADLILYDKDFIGTIAEEAIEAYLKDVPEEKWQYVDIAMFNGNASSLVAYLEKYLTQKTEH